MLLPATALYWIPRYIDEWILYHGIRRPTFRDGKRVAVVGTVDSDNAPLISPISKTECLSYSYGIYHMIKKSQGRRSEGRSQGSMEVAEYFYYGKNNVPLLLSLSDRTIRLLTFTGGTEMKQWKGNDPAIAENLHPFLQTTAFEKGDAHGGVGLEVDERRDYQSPVAPGEPESWQVVENHLPLGKEIVVAGIWSSERKGLTHAGLGEMPYTVLTGGAQGFLRDIFKRILRLALVTIATTALINLFIFIYYTT